MYQNAHVNSKITKLLRAVKLTGRALQIESQMHRWHHVQFQLLQAAATAAKTVQQCIENDIIMP
jgi:hypothetical protein